MGLGHRIIHQSKYVPIGVLEGNAWSSIEQERLLVGVSGISLFVLVLALSLSGGLDNTHARWNSGDGDNQKVERVGDGVRSRDIPFIVFVETIEDFVGSTVSQGQRNCQVKGIITGETALAQMLGIHSNDFRFVLYSGKVHNDGSFHVFDILPGTYIAAPLPKDTGKLIFSPPTGRIIACKNGETFEVKFSVQELRHLTTRTKKNLNSKIQNVQPDKKPSRQVARQSDSQWSDSRRQALVLRILKGQTTFQNVAQEHGLSIEQLERWRDDFLSNIEKALGHAK